MEIGKSMPIGKHPTQKFKEDFNLVINQAMCSSYVLLERLGRIAHEDHVNHYWWSRGVGLIGYYNDLFLARGEPK